MSEEVLSAREMAQLTMLTGRLCEVQIKNLQAYPLIMFNGVRDCEVSWDIATEKDQPSQVEYKIHTAKNAENEKLEKRCKDLEKAVWNIFWNSVEVQIFLNDESIYKTEKPKVEKKDEQAK